MSEVSKLYQASAHHLPMIESASVQCIVTSPPYFGLRKYDGAQDIEWGEVSYSPMVGLPALNIPAMTCPLGNEATIEAFIGHLVLCAREWHRVLVDDGVCWVNLGDSFSGSSMMGGTKSKEGGNDRVSRMFSKEKQAVGLAPKNLMLIPARFALAMQADGWILRSEVIWHKPNPMPESVTDRPTKAHEQIYLFSKQERYFYDAEAVREPAKDWGSRDRSNGKITSGEPPIAGGAHHGLTDGNFAERGRNMRSVWTVATQPFSGAHFACFPSALVEPMIKAGSRVGDTVLDPFGGSQTTGKVAISLGRKYIGIDLSEKYLDELAPERLTVQIEMAV